MLSFYKQGNKKGKQPATQPRRANAKHTTMVRCNWGFHVNIKGPDAVKLLKETGEHGSYLCRRSATSPGSYTLDVRRDDTVWHFKIHNLDGESFELYNDDGFASVPDLIQYYQENPAQFKDKDNKPIELLQPLLQEDVEDLGLDQEKWFFGDISRQIAEDILKKRGAHGSYLVRESRTQPGNYVLSIRNHTEVTEFLIIYSDGTFDVDSGKQLGFSSMHALIQYYTKYPLIDRGSDSAIPLIEALCDTAERLKNSQRIKKEFEALQHEDKANTSTKLEGQKPENRVKNRYKNILPFDHTRVILRNTDHMRSSNDYINASYVFDDESGALFIASQGCMRTTVDDFWHMMYQENTRIIIMVTNEIEKSKIKCVRYWPEPGMSITAAGKMVTNTGQTSTRDYMVRQLEVHDIDAVDGSGETAATGKPRKIFHYQFIGWPDHGVPSDPGSLLEMMQLIEATQQTFEVPGPQVIHCSAGIGRTGTVITIRMLMRLYEKKGHLEERDIPRTVQKVRLQRSGMVQTEAQYNFIYQAIVFYVETIEQRMKSTKQDTNVYGNLSALSDQMAAMNPK